MRLKDAARFFDRTSCDDAYAPGSPFLAQLDLFDDSKRDGATVARRVLMVDADVALPARGAFTAHGETFILGGVHQDSFSGSVVRKKYVCHRADGLAAVKTLEQAILGQAGTAVYGARLWVKDMKQIDVSSDLNGFFDLFFHAGETVDVGSVVDLAGRLHLVRQAYVSAAGFLAAEADELPETARTAVTAYAATGGQAYDPSTDSFGAAAPVACSALWHRFQAHFEYLRPAAVTFQPGDVIVNVSKADVPQAAAGDTFTMLGDDWRVRDARDNGANVWMLHAGRV